MSVTKIKGESRMDAAKRTSTNPLGIEVKLADLEHNMDLSRLPKVTEKDLARYDEYKKVKNFLENAKGKLSD